MPNTRTYFKNNTTSQPTKLFNMTQKEKLETLTGEKFPEPTPQLYKQQYPNSPFWVIETQNGYNLIMGKYKLNKEPFPTLQDLEIWIQYDKWNIQLSMTICIVTDMLNNQNKQ